jgi:hypothetical protein
MTQEAATTLTNLTSRIDTRLSEIQTGVQEVQAEIRALPARLQTLKSRLLLIYDLAALLATLLFVWVIYSQFVVIRHHARLFRTPAPAISAPLPPLEAGAVETPGVAVEELRPLPSAEVAAVKPVEAVDELSDEVGGAAAPAETPVDEPSG